MAYTPEELAFLQKFRGQHHGGLSWDMVRDPLSPKGQKRERMRSTPDRRLFEAMSAQQTQAFLNIGKAHALMNSGMGVRAQDIADMLIGKSMALGDPEYGAHLIIHYKTWKDFCVARRIHTFMAEDIIIYGLSLNESAKIRKRRKDAVRLNLFACLDAWWRLRPR